MGKSRTRNLDEALEILTSATRVRADLEGTFRLFRNKRELEDAKLIQGVAYRVLCDCGYQEQADAALDELVDDTNHEPLFGARIFGHVRNAEMVRGLRR